MSTRRSTGVSVLLTEKVHFACLRCRSLREISKSMSNRSSTFPVRLTVASSWQTRRTAPTCFTSPARIHIQLFSEIQSSRPAKRYDPTNSTFPKEIHTLQHSYWFPKPHTLFFQLMTVLRRKPSYDVRQKSWNVDIAALSSSSSNKGLTAALG